MRKLLLIVGLLVGVGIIAGWVSGDSAEAKQNINPNIIRLHVRANSDSDADQALKKKVRNAVLKKFSILNEAKSIDQSREIIKQNIPAIEKEAARVIAKEGKNYPVKVEFGYANFPVKSYGEVTYPAGTYEALQIIIGEGKGQNWWCVLFPPLCFVDVTNTLAHNPGVAAPALQNTQQAQEVKPVVKLKTVEVIKDLAAKF